MERANASLEAQDAANIVKSDTDAAHNSGSDAADAQTVSQEITNAERMDDNNVGESGLEQESSDAKGCLAGAGAAGLAIAGALAESEEDQKLIAAESKRTLPVLGYWRMRGVAQPIRFLLAHLEIEYEERLFELGDAPDFSPSEWTEAAGTLELDFPKLPYYIDVKSEVRLTGAFAIMKYISLLSDKSEALLGNTLEEKA